VQDFGEHLVEVREHLEVPLPLRVSFWRVFAAVALEAFSMAVIFTLRRDWRSCVQDHKWLTSPRHDFEDVMAQFQRLNGRRATEQQIEQAQEALIKQTQRRLDRCNHETELWLIAVHRGIFIGSLLSSLLLVSMMMCLLTNRLFAVWIIMLGSLLAQLLGAIICVRGWHRL
jgi:hypothetical protein